MTFYIQPCVENKMATSGDNNDFVSGTCSGTSGFNGGESFSDSRNSVTSYCMVELKGL